MHTGTPSQSISFRPEGDLLERLARLMQRVSLGPFAPSRSAILNKALAAGLAIVEAAVERSLVTAPTLPPEALPIEGEHISTTLGEEVIR